MNVSKHSEWPAFGNRKSTWNSAYSVFKTSVSLISDGNRSASSKRQSNLDETVWKMDWSEISPLAWWQLDSKNLWYHQDFMIQTSKSPQICKIDLSDGWRSTQKFLNQKLLKEVSDT